MPNTSSFYDTIMNDAQSLMAKQASADPEVLSDILNDSDLNESDLQKIATQLDQMLQEDPEDIDDDIDVGGDNAGNEPTPDETLEDNGEGGEQQPADENDVDPETDPDNEEGSNDEGEEQTAEFDEADFAKLAAHYDETQEKYASAGLGVADYAYDQMGCPEDAQAVKLATLIGEKAEKLAYVAEISPYAVADDLLMAVADLVTAEEETQGE